MDRGKSSRVQMLRNQFCTIFAQMPIPEFTCRRCFVVQVLICSYMTGSELNFGSIGACIVSKFLQTALQSDPVTSPSSKKVVDHPPSPALLLQLGSLEQRMLIQVRVVSRAFELYWWQCRTSNQHNQCFA